MFLILRVIKFKLLIFGLCLSFLFSGCSGDVSAICNGKKSRILYSKRDYKKLLETKKCQDCKLNGNQADLSNLDLSEANLSGTGLALANLSGTNLEQANLSKADLRRANLTNTNLEQTSLTGAVYRKASTLEKETKENPNTIFPKGFDPIKAEMIRM